MKVSVIIVTFRGAERLGRLLPTVLEPNGPPASPLTPLEVIVFDDGSPVEDAAAIERAVASAQSGHRTVTLLRDRANRSYAPCVRDAVAASSGDVVLLLDDDTHIPDGFFTVLRTLMGSLANVGVLAWRSEGKNPGQSQHAVPGMMQPATQLASYCYAFPRKVWDEIGGFDVRYKFYCIDSDFALRAVLAGHPSYRVWWPLVLHDEHGGAVDTVSFDRRAIGEKDSALFKEKWGATGDEMEARALKALLERAER
jgi:GT2 family glycosyltransferase